MMYIVLILSTVFLISFVGFLFFPPKSSLICGRLGLIASGEIGCGIVMNFGGSFRFNRFFKFIWGECWWFLVIQWQWLLSNVLRFEFLI